MTTDALVPLTAEEEIGFREAADNADILEEGGDPALADEYRAIVARMRAAFEDPREHVKYKLGLRKVEPMDPDELAPAFGVTFWHEPRYSPTVVCPCGHFARFLCDQPVGKGLTCDAPLCLCCRAEVTEGIDQCDFHQRTKPGRATRRVTNR